MLAEFDRCSREGRRGRRAKAVRRACAAYSGHLPIRGATSSSTAWRSCDQGALPHLPVALGPVRVLRPSAPDEAAKAASSKTTTAT